MNKQAENLKYLDIEALKLNKSHEITSAAWMDVF